MAPIAAGLDRTFGLASTRIDTKLSPSTTLHSQVVTPFRQERGLRMVAAASEKPPVVSAATLEKPAQEKRLRPDSQGRFGKFGGKYVPETLIAALTELEDEFNKAIKDPDFQVCPGSFKTCSIF